MHTGQLAWRGAWQQTGDSWSFPVALVLGISAHSINDIEGMMGRWLGQPGKPLFLGAPPEALIH